MTDWIDKIPDSLTGVVVAGAVWFGFNYVVLAERAMAKDHLVAAPSCGEAIDRHERGLQIAPIGIGKLLGVPQLDEIESTGLKLLKPRRLSQAEKGDLCTCAATAAGRGLRFDYAVHTASFRMIEPQAVSGLGAATIDVLGSGICGALPQLKRLG